MAKFTVAVNRLGELHGF